MARENPFIISPHHGDHPASHRSPSVTIMRMCIVQLGANNSATQLQLIQGIIGLAFGGAMTFTNVSFDITGILNLGTFAGEKINLRAWFDGSGFECDSKLSQSPLQPRPRSFEFCLREGWTGGGGKRVLTSYDGQNVKEMLVGEGF